MVNWLWDIFFQLLWTITIQHYCGSLFKFVVVLCHWGTPPTPTTPHTLSCLDWTVPICTVAQPRHANTTSPDGRTGVGLGPAERSEADPAAAIHQGKRPAVGWLLCLAWGGRTTSATYSKPAFVCVCVCTRATVAQQQAPNANDCEWKSQKCSWMKWKPLVD